MIIHGSHDEDFPTRLVIAPNKGPTVVISGSKLTVYLRANNHYRHAISGNVLTGAPIIGMGDPDVDALSWAKTNMDFSKDEEYGGDQWWAIKNGVFTEQELDSGNMSWQKAINRYGYSDHSKKLSYYTLGFVLHLLQDMGVPEHVHDDPHGGSGYTGFEKWVEVNWEQIVPNFVPKLNTLKIKRFGKDENIDLFFDNLAKIAYSSNRFAAQFTRPDWAGRQSIIQWCDLAKMFKVNYDWLDESWCLENYPLFPIPDSEAGAYYWHPISFTHDPFSHKGGKWHWWPTHLELPDKKNDDAGFYYIELSDEFPPISSRQQIISRERYLYPKAYIPTPLRSVANQCKGWEVEKCKPRTHLYQLIGERMFPKIIEHCAGLMEHFYEIVNHPPYVQKVKVLQKDGPKYVAFWNDEAQSSAESIDQTKSKTEEVEKRQLVTTVSEEPKPGLVTVEVTFSEPVKDVQIKWDNYVQNGSPVLDREDEVWQAEFKIDDEDLRHESITVSVKASDKDRHFADKGGNLDTNPGTPARRKCSGQEDLIYEWESNYEDTGFDSHYVIGKKKSTDLTVHVQDGEEKPIQDAQVKVEFKRSEEQSVANIEAQKSILRGEVEAAEKIKSQLRKTGQIPEIQTGMTNTAGEVQFDVKSGWEMKISATAEGHKDGWTSIAAESPSLKATIILDQKNEFYFLGGYHTILTPTTNSPKSYLFYLYDPEINPYDRSAIINHPVRLRYDSVSHIHSLRQTLKSEGIDAEDLPYMDIVRQYAHLSTHKPTTYPKIYGNLFNKENVIEITCKKQTRYAHNVWCWIEKSGKKFWGETSWGYGYFELDPGEHRATVTVHTAEGKFAEFNVSFNVVKGNLIKKGSGIRSKWELAQEHIHKIKIKERELLKNRSGISFGDIRSLCVDREYALLYLIQIQIPPALLHSMFDEYVRDWNRWLDLAIKKGSVKSEYFRLDQLSKICLNIGTPKAREALKKAITRVEPFVNMDNRDSFRLGEAHRHAANLAIMLADDVGDAIKHLKLYYEIEQSRINEQKVSYPPETWPKIKIEK